MQPRFESIDNNVASRFLRTITALAQQRVTFGDRRFVYELVPGATEPIDHYDLLGFELAACPTGDDHDHIRCVRVVRRFDLQLEDDGTVADRERACDVLMMVARETFAMHVGSDMREIVALELEAGRHGCEANGVEP